MLVYVLSTLAECGTPAESLQVTRIRFCFRKCDRSTRRGRHRKVHLFVIAPLLGYFRYQTSKVGRSFMLSARDDTQCPLSVSRY